jgi:exonuclease I
LKIISELSSQDIEIQKEEEESKVEDFEINFDNKHILNMFYEFKNENYFENQRKD